MSKVQEIEKMSDLKKNDGSEGAIIFDNSGNMVVNNRKYRRNFKQLWRAVQEGRESIHFYTKNTNRRLGKTACRRRNKIERQNRKLGRAYNGR